MPVTRAEGTGGGTGGPFSAAAPSGPLSAPWPSAATAPPAGPSRIWLREMAARGGCVRFIFILSYLVFIFYFF